MKISRHKSSPNYKMSSHTCKITLDGNIVEQKYWMYADDGMDEDIEEGEEPVGEVEIVLFDENGKYSGTELQTGLVTIDCHPQIVKYGRICPRRYNAN